MIISMGTYIIFSHAVSCILMHYACVCLCFLCVNVLYLCTRVAILFSKFYSYRFIPYIAWSMFSQIHLFQFISTQNCRFVQFGEDQNCYCGALSCRQKLGNKPSKPKLSSDAALKLVAPEVAVSSPSVKGLLSKNDVSSGWVYDIQFCLFSLIFWHFLLDLETKMTNFCNLRVVLYDTCIEECVSNG